MSARLPPAGSPARPGDALAICVNRGDRLQRIATAGCGSADRLATSTMRTVHKAGRGGGPLRMEVAGNAHRGLLQRQICRPHPNT